MLIDITGKKVSIPTSLFLLLSPGLMSGRTSRHEVLMRALIALILYKLVSYPSKITLTKADLIVPTILFILLSPGMLLTIPPGSKGLSNYYTFSCFCSCFRVTAKDFSFILLDD